MEFGGLLVAGPLGLIPVLAHVPPKTNGALLLFGAAVTALVGLGNLAIARRTLAKPDLDARQRRRAQAVRITWGYGIGIVATAGLAITGVIILITGR